MSTRIDDASPLSFTTFGDLLRYLRRRAHLTQRDLGTAVDYNFGQICRLEQNQRSPNRGVVRQHFLPALDLDPKSPWALRLLELTEIPRAAQSSRPASPSAVPAKPETPADHRDASPVDLTPADAEHQIEPIPHLARHSVARPRLEARIRSHLNAGQRVAICGLPGMGKSNLAAAVAHAHRQSAPVFWLTLTKQINTNVDALIRQLALFLFVQGQLQMKPLLAVGEPNQRALPLDRQAVLLQSGLSQLAQRVGAQPLLVFNNVHLLPEDGPAWQLLHHLAATASTTALLMTSRESVQLPLCKQIRLDGLEVDEALALIDLLRSDVEEGSGTVDLSTLIPRLLEKTGRSPMFLRLAMSQLLDEGADAETFIRHLESHSKITLYLLETVQQALSSAAWKVLQLIAVFRRNVNLRDPDLLELYQTLEPGSDVALATAELQQRQLIDHPTIARLHPLVRDFVYDTLLADRPRRQQLHRIAAEWSDDVAGEPLEAGYHYLQLGELQHSLDSLSERQSDLFRRGQALAAAAILDEAIAVAQRRSSPAELTGDLLAERGWLLNGTSRTSDAESSYRQALTLTTHPQRRARWSGRLGQILLRRGNPTEALAVVERGMSGLTQEDVLLHASLALTGGAACRQLSRFDEALRMTNHALSLAQALADAEEGAACEIRARAHYQLGVMMHQRDQTQAAIDHWQAALQAAEQADMPHLETMSRGSLAILLQSLGKLAEAARTRQTAVEQALAMGDSYSAGYFLGHMSDLARLRGHFDSAHTHLDEAYTLLVQVGDVWGIANTDKKRAEVLISMGKISEAQDLIQRVLQRLDANLPIRDYVEYLQVLANTQILQNQLAEADITLQKAFRIGSVVERPRVLNKLTVTMTMSLVAEDRLEDASAVLAEWPLQTNDIFLKFDYWLATALVALAERNPSEARRLCTQVAGQAAELGATLHRQSAEHILEILPAPPPLSHFPRLLWIASPQS